MVGDMGIVFVSESYTIEVICRIINQFSEIKWYSFLKSASDYIPQLCGDLLKKIQITEGNTRFSNEQWIAPLFRLLRKKEEIIKKISFYHSSVAFDYKFMQ